MKATEVLRSFWVEPFKLVEGLFVGVNCLVIVVELKRNDIKYIPASSMDSMGRMDIHAYSIRCYVICILHA